MIIHGDSIEELKKLPANSVDAVVTDPPYGLGNFTSKDIAECMAAWVNDEQWEAKGSGFMGKAWDAFVPPPQLWREVLRVLKAGGHILAFAGSRTQDLMSISLRLAGAEVRDCLMWLYGKGFPKSHNISKAIDKHYGVEGEVISIDKRHNYSSGLVKAGQGERYEINRKITAPSSDDAKKWEGWGTALKPNYEPVILARKPLDGTVVNNVLTHGVGGLNIDGCRIKSDRDLGRMNKKDNGMFACGNGASSAYIRKQRGLEPLGLWPSNILLDEIALKAMGETSRFFYCAKSQTAERHAGLEGLKGNIHPTVKPIKLMRYLCRLVTPKGGTILEPFAGSGTTLIAAHLEGFNYIGIEREEEYVNIIKARIKHWAGENTADTSETKKEANRGKQLNLFS